MCARDGENEGGRTKGRSGDAVGICVNSMDGAKNWRLGRSYRKELEVKKTYRGVLEAP